MGEHRSVISETGLPMRCIALRIEGAEERQYWVPDARRAEVRDALRRGAEALARSPAWEEDMAFIEAVQYWPPDDPH